ncbi:Arylsulfatase [Aureliella helgolandensis]|uniref:Arylsulfatase n=2 Tax=Aureliella helgolandensis TaxID=2527968 RepID=A0A518G7M2_9BACT|nr:Arylsulfatase [Aureliella helgolandensis]
MLGVWLLHLLWSGGLLAATPAEGCPNILFILVDDLGWSDLACYGHQWHDTPHLDRLAGEGLRFTNAYAAAPICSASRASIMTGKTTARTNFEFVTKDKPGRQQIDAPTLLRAPPFTLDLPLQELTVAERLAALGYQTAFFGKWHLNAHFGGYLGWSPTHGPAQQGFEFTKQDFGNHPYAWRGGNRPDPIEANGVFADDSMVQGVVEYLEAEHKQPFFACVSSFYVHTPVQTPLTWLVNKYDAKIPAEVPQRKQRIAYAAFLETLDHHLGQVLEAVERSGQRDSTLVVLMSDNGGHPEYTANGPLRGSKWNLYEGGIRVPMLVRWPGHVDGGKTSCEPVIGYDLLPTFVDIAGGAADDVDGVSLKEHLRNASSLEPRKLIWHFPYYHPEKGYAQSPDSIGVDDFETSRTHPHSAMRQGDFKLLQFYEQDATELYDVVHDIAEQDDLSSRFPSRAAEMKAQLQAELVEMQARFPTPTHSLDAVD